MWIFTFSRASFTFIYKDKYLSVLKNMFFFVEEYTNHEIHSFIFLCAFIDIE